MTTWADRITSLEGIGWSLTRLGRAIGLSAQGVSDIKQGRTKAPTGMAAVQLYRMHEAQTPPPADEAESIEAIEHKAVA